MKQIIVILLIILLLWAVTKTEMFQETSLFSEIGNFARSGENYGKFRQLHPEISPLKFTKLIQEYKEGNLTDERMNEIMKG
jgi:hypothetical protein